ncbi:mariner Mos1 transposase [Trichonephila clavipes]|uniref:Mariner Mos1 transposase n=1 Tax=Trichonephila clavipes TaxID=2585209 RepID=A0A8X6V989_TRICX|nr:mariner Mos1 transposase [Trichonephila clavipes]
MICCAVLLEPQLLDIMIVQFRNEKVSNHGSIPITIDCNVVAFIVFEEGFHQPIKRTKQKGKNAIQARKKFTDVYGEGVLTVRQCQNWFAKFRSGNFDVEDPPRSGKPVETDKDVIKALVDANRQITTLEIGLSFSINSEVYCHQLDKLNDALQQKRSELINRKGVVFHQDNAIPHTSLVTHQKLLQLECDTMTDPPYSSDLAPSDYYLLRSLQNSLDGKTFTSNEEVKNHLDQFFASKDQKFYERGIMLLPERWQKVLDQNSQYII